MTKTILAASILTLTAAANANANPDYNNPSKEDCATIAENPYSDYLLTRACLSKAYPKWNPDKEFTVGYLYKSPYPCDIVHVLLEFEDLTGQKKVVVEYISSCGGYRGQTYTYKKAFDMPWSNLGLSPFNKEVK